MRAALRLPSSRCRINVTPSDSNAPSTVALSAPCRTWSAPPRAPRVRLSASTIRHLPRPVAPGGRLRPGPKLTRHSAPRARSRTLGSLSTGGPYWPYLEHPTYQTAGRRAGADACVAGPGDRRQASKDAILLSPPAPWHRPSGTPVFEPAACSSSGRYSPLAYLFLGDQRAAPAELFPEPAVELFGRAEANHLEPPRMRAAPDRVPRRHRTAPAPVDAHLGRAAKHRPPDVLSWRKHDRTHGQRERVHRHEHEAAKARLEVRTAARH